MNEFGIRLAAWNGFANSLLSGAVFVTLVLFFAIGGAWGTVNDAISVVWALSYVPLLILLYQINGSENRALGRTMLVAGIVSMICFAFLQSLLVLRLVRFEQTFLMVIFLGGVLGLVLMIHGLQARGGQTLPDGLTRLLIAFGLGYVVSAVGFWLGGWQNPLAALGYLVGAVTGPIWPFQLGKLLLAGRLPVFAEFGFGGSS